MPREVNVNRLNRPRYSAKLGRSDYARRGRHGRGRK